MTAEITARRLRQCREEAHETLEQVAALVGVNRSTVLRWERGDTCRIQRPVLERLARHYGVSVGWLQGSEVRREDSWLPKNALSLDDLIDQPVWGQEAASPLLAQNFWLRVTDDRMAPTLLPGDLILVRPDVPVAKGGCALLLLDGEPMIRRVSVADGVTELTSDNPYIPVCRIPAESERLHILGAVTESRRSFL